MTITPAYQDNLTTLYYGDCSDVMKQLPNNIVSLINTDPPYTQRMLHSAYTILARESSRVMKYGASLTMLVGHFAVDQIIKIFHNSGLKYNWIIKMDQPGHHIRMPLGIEVTWMPILWYIKSHNFIYSFMPDGFEVTGTNGIDKLLHPWQKDLSWSDFLIKNITSPHDTVLDPFMGSGTTIISARKLERYSIGVDNDPIAVMTTIKRIKEHDSANL